MRKTYLVIGIAALIIVLGGIYASRHPFTNDQAAVESINTRMTLSLTSTAFTNGGSIPSKYTCDGNREINPPLAIDGVPEGAKSLVLIVDDPDVPKVKIPSGIYDHWVLFNIPPQTTEIGEGQSAGIRGANSHGASAFTGPCPPPEYEPSEHRYFFKLYALDTQLQLQEGASKQEVEKAMDGHVIGRTEMIGRYKRQ